MPGTLIDMGDDGTVQPKCLGLVVIGTKDWWTVTLETREISRGIGG
jgi:hypothetical protein